MQKTVYKVADFVGWQKAKCLELSPRFQRRAVWRAGAKSYLMDTILRDFPVPIIFLRDRGTDPKTLMPMREVVDGQQRLRTIFSFVSEKLLPDFDEGRDRFVISKAHNAEACGKKFEELDDISKQVILNYEFSVQILPASMDDREVVQMFRRLNSTNYTLNKQELRNATFFGEFKSSALQLSAEQIHRWREWGTFNDDDISRMSEIELTAECMLSILEGRIGGRLGKRLDWAYEQYDAVFSERVEVERRFRQSLEHIYNDFASVAKNSPLLKKRLIYTLILAVCDALFDLSAPLSKAPVPKKLVSKCWDALSAASDKIQKRTAPDTVLQATDRRTNDLKERKALFGYLRKCF